MTPPGDHRYFASTAVLLNEVLKLAISLTFALHEVSRSLAPQTPVTVLFEQVYNSVFSGDGWKLAIPAMLFTLENTLQYVALGNLDAVHFQILFQLKVWTTSQRERRDKRCGSISGKLTVQTIADFRTTRSSQRHSSAS